MRIAGHHQHVNWPPELTKLARCGEGGLRVAKPCLHILKKVNGEALAVWALNPAISLANPMHIPTMLLFSLSYLSYLHGLILYMSPPHPCLQQACTHVLFVPPEVTTAISEAPLASFHIWTCGLRGVIVQKSLYCNSTP